MRSDPAWRFPRGTWWTVWLLLMAGYTFSGFTKLASPSWVDGSALRHLLENPLARPGLPRDLFLALPTTLTSVATWSVLAVELTALPLALWRRTRFLAWTLTGGMHLVVLLFVSFADLSRGMLMAHAFTYDPAWLISTRANRREGDAARGPTPRPEPADADAVNAQ